MSENKIYFSTSCSQGLLFIYFQNYQDFEKISSDCILMYKMYNVQYKICKMTNKFI